MRENNLKKLGYLLVTSIQHEHIYFGSISAKYYYIGFQSLQHWDDFTI